MFRNTDRSLPFGGFFRGMSGGSSSTDSLFGFAASIAAREHHQALHSLCIGDGNTENFGGFFQGWERRFDNGRAAHFAFTLTFDLQELKWFDAAMVTLGSKVREATRNRKDGTFSINPIPVISERPALAGRDVLCTARPATAGRSARPTFLSTPSTKPSCRGPPICRAYGTLVRHLAGNTARE